MKYSAIVSSVAAGLLLVTLAPASVRAAGFSACAISAWSSDTDSNGLNIRAGAGSDTAIVGHIPLSMDFAAEVSIIGSQNGWFQIDKAVYDDYDALEPETLFTGTGWVSGRLLALGLNDADLHTAPAPDSPVLAQLLTTDANGNAMGPDSFIVTRLHGCVGDWVEVEGTFLDAPLRGWATRTCANQVTTCP